MQVRLKTTKKIQGDLQLRMILWLSFWQLHMVSEATFTVPNIRKSYGFGSRVKEMETVLLKSYLFTFQFAEKSQK